MRWALPVGIAVFVLSQSLWIAVPVAALTYLAHVWFNPYAKCLSPRCRRDGPRVTDGSGEVWHDCLVCGGSGKRRRPLSRLIGGLNV